MLPRVPEALDNQAPHLRRGFAAEEIAARYLRARGLAVLARNLRCRTGEIDLIALDGDILAIIEVRQRCSRHFGGAIGSVTRRKQRRILRAAQFFWQRRLEWRAHVMRFDVIALDGVPDGAYALVWFKDAFRAG